MEDELSVEELLAEIKLVEQYSRFRLRVEIAGKEYIVSEVKGYGRVQLGSEKDKQEPKFVLKLTLPKDR